MIFSLAHLSDPHLPLPRGCPPLGSLTAKQMLALAAWYRRRRHVTSPAVLDALSRDLAAHAPDHIAVTGDLVNLAWPPEFAQARHWLAALGPPDRVSVVPGNHDATRATAWPQGIGQWSPWMADDANGMAEDAAPFPYLRRRGEVAILGLCSALPTPVSCAAGRLGAAQLRRAAALLDGAARDGLFRVVLIHHPPTIGPGGRRKALRDRAALCAMLARHGAELVLHGHHHASRLVALPGPAGPIPSLGVASASAGAACPEAAGWRLHGIAREATGWRLTTQTRRYDPATGRFSQAGTWHMHLPDAHPRWPGGGLLAAHRPRNLENRD